MFTSIFIPDKHTRELRIYVNQMNKKLKFISFIKCLYLNKKLRKVREKQSIMSLSMYDREISHSGSEFNQGFGKPRWF